MKLEKRIARQGYASVNVEDNLISNTRSVNVSYRYHLPFAQSSATARFSNAGVQTTPRPRGSLSFGSGEGYIHTDNRSATGIAGITIVPFLDINFNCKKDEYKPAQEECSKMYHKIFHI